MKVEKGQPGYIKARKNRLLIWTIAEFAIVAAVLILGWTQTGTRLNALTVVAVAGCLPASKMLVQFIAIAPFRPIEQEKYEETEEKARLLTTAYDLVLTSKEKIMQVDAIVISDQTVCGYTSHLKTDEAKASAHIKEMLRLNHYDKITVKIFRDYKAFTARVEGMNSIAAVDRPDTNPDSNNKEQKLRHHILNVSL